MTSHAPVRRALSTLIALAAVVSACGTGPAAPSAITAPPGSTGSPLATSAGASGSPAGASCSADGAPASIPGWEAGPKPNAEIIPILASSELTVRDHRMLFTVVGAGNKQIAAPELAVTADFYRLERDPAQPAFSPPVSFLWAEEGKRGLYRTDAPFDCAGEWGAEIRVPAAAGAPARTARLRFTVREASMTPELGSAAPAADTPTATTAEEIKRISSDPSPDPAFYRRSLKEALGTKKPVLLSFSTPLFCQTALCGPTLEVIKSAAAPFKDRVELVHVEPYKLAFEGGQLQPVLGRLPGEPEDAQPHLLPVEAVDKWRLPNEPYTFVIDAQGRVAAKFEGVVGRDELEKALAAVSS